MGKVLFFDIDGTLIDFSGKLPSSTLEAIEAAKAAGHFIFICTGRSRSQLQEELNQIAYDGVVGASGAYVEIGAKEYHHVYIPKDTARKAVDFFRKDGAIFSCQTENRTLMDVGNPERFLAYMKTQKDVSEKQAQRILARGDGSHTIDYHMGEIEKIIYFCSNTPFKEVKKILGDEFEITRMSFDKPDDFSGEITRAGITKAYGMQKVLEYYGLTREDCIAFGDGPNDFEMIEFAGTGVVMGNGIPELKEKADFITTSINEDGIKYAMNKLLLI